MKISVVVPTYNRRELLKRALLSVFSQISLPAEVTVIDDGSTDGTELMLRREFPQVNYYYQENLGVSAARNLGIQQATGDWLAFLDSDDEWLPEKLAAQKTALTANPEYKGTRKPKIKDITVIYNEDPTASAQALKNGEVSIIEPQATADLLKSLQGNDKIEVLTGTTATYEHIDLQMANGGPFDPAKYGGDAEKAKKVRQAFLLTVPRQQIVDTLIKPLNPEATTRDSFNVTPGTPAYDATVAGNGLAAAYGKVDIEKAKSLLAEAGASNVKVRLMYAKANPRRQQEYALIAQSAKLAGIEVINAGDDDWSNKLGTPNAYDASLFAWASNNDAVTSAAANFVPKGQNNFGNYNSAEVGKMYAEMNSLTDKAQQDELNIKIEKQLVDDAFGTVLFQHPGIDAYDKTKVKNVSQMNFVPYYFWNVWDWELAG